MKRALITALAGVGLGVILWIGAVWAWVVFDREINQQDRPW